MGQKWQNREFTLMTPLPTKGVSILVTGVPASVLISYEEIFHTITFNSLLEVISSCFKGQFCQSPRVCVCVCEHRTEWDIQDMSIKQTQVTNHIVLCKSTLLGMCLAMVCIMYYVVRDCHTTLLIKWNYFVNVFKMTLARNNVAPWGWS
jgi:hypothetical protein